MINRHAMNRRSWLLGAFAFSAPVAYGDTPMTKKLIHASVRLCKGMHLLSINPLDEPALIAASRAFSYLSGGISVLLGNDLGDAQMCREKARGAITAAIELTRGGPGTVANLRGVRDHPALHALRRARTLLEAK